MNPERIELQSLLPPGSRVLCAVSGGADSMCLLHLLWSRREALGIQVFAAHYEHGLRGEESLRDAAFVENWCRERGIPCQVAHGDVRARAAQEHLSLEDAGRRLRYAFLEQSADALGCDRIATAHNADDNAETILLNLIRGAGLAGLGGIPPVRGRIVRPLIGCTRAEIEAYLTAQGVAFMTDSSNAGDEYSRNRIRHRVTPVLRELNPAFAEAAGRSAQLLRQDEDCLEQLAAAFVEEHFDGESLPVGKLLALHPAVSSRVVRKLCGSGLEQTHVEAVMALCRGSGLAWADLPGRRVRREQRRLYFTETEAVCLPERELIPGQTLELPEAGLRIRTELAVCEKEIHDLFKTLNFKYENICGKILFCTGRRPGDRIRPQGRNCSKSLKALFLEAGMTQRERDRTPVIRDAQGVLAVLGLAVDERAAAAPGDRVVRLQIEKREGDGE